MVEVQPIVNQPVEKRGTQPLTLDDVRTVQLSILDRFVTSCDSHGLRFYLCAGTLLGAIRHRGYIPWDDDIDVMMPRPDFERFASICSSELGRQGVSVVRPTDSTDYPFPFIKLSDDRTRLEHSGLPGEPGINIDVFPLDGWRRGRAGRLIQRASLNLLGHIMTFKLVRSDHPRSRTRRFVLRLGKLVFSPLPVSSVRSGLSRVATWQDFGTARDRGVLVWGYRERVPRDAYGDPARAAFEGRWLPVPRDAATVLRLVFGPDYLDLPPPEERKTHHEFTAYWREHPGARD